MDKRKCAACGDEFEARSSTAKYCDDCRKHKRTASFYAKAVALNRHHIGDYGASRLQKCTCTICGKTFIAYANTSYCSAACRHKAVAQHARCPICNTLLMSKGIFSGKGCCSEECSKEFFRRNAEKAKKIARCEYCGNEYIRRSDNQRFCCKQCYTNYRNDEKQKHATVEKERKTPTEIRSCPVCRKPFETTIWKSFSTCCSPECQQNLGKMSRLPSDEERWHPEVKPCSLCVSCKTSQKECERFLSQFKYYPKGALVKEVNGKEMVISCPKFKNFKEKKHA